MKRAPALSTPPADVANPQSRLDEAFALLEQRITGMVARQKSLQAPREELTRMLSQLAEVEQENQKLLAQLQEATRKEQLLHQQYAAIAEKLDRAILKLEHLREIEEVGG